MPEVTGNAAQGTPCWMNLVGPDAATAESFYGPLLGWEFERAGAEYGGYVVATVGGKKVAGITGGMPGPAFWGIYFATDDCDGAAKRATDAGAELVTPPEEVGPLGRMAVLTDPQGATFGLWQGREHIGAELVNEPGALAWNELVTADTAASAAFYGTVLGVSNAPIQPGVDYLTLTVAGRPVCGIFGVPRPQLDAAQNGNAAWKVYFAVPNADTTAQTATTHGGKILQPPINSPFGRFTVLTDPLGAEFAAISPTPPHPQ
ncbi:VOC family protein [Actinocorallia sp. A-T 12471]|uniref:VOC family protein n=1 Tax=Actinocorallia sp. A-T 12471 TaxID=3089813 RepID=UPI0029CE45CE|nr:VOC family protein [Actinocorallia sp. A-T 12471]MDX6740524.1 VOC family protein [Actinocorallia sp. A-T 12471]